LVRHRFASWCAPCKGTNAEQSIPECAALLPGYVPQDERIERCLLVIATRGVIDTARKYKRRGASHQRFDQHQFLVGVVDERGTAYAVARLRARHDIERLVVVGGGYGFLAGVVIVGRNVGDAVAGTDVTLLGI